MRDRSHLSSSRLIATLVAFVAVFIASGAEASPSAAGDPSRAENTGPTGVFDGAVQPAPDPKTGTFTYAYPFDLPEARGPAQPQLSLGYSSSARRDQEAGYGWGLSLPTIERRPMSGNPRFENTPSDDRFFFSGQPLVRMCKQLPCSEGKPHPEWTGWVFYRLQTDTMHARFYRSPDGRQWRVQLKDTGTRLEFGASGASDDGIEYLDGDPKHIVRWRLVRHIDVHHMAGSEARNRVEYRWKRLGDAAGDPLLYLTAILDTPRPTGGGGDLDYAHHTELTWESPEFAQAHYADAFHAGPSLRLSRVAVTSMPWSGAGPRQLVRRYWLRYAAPRRLAAYVADAMAPLWHHSFLREIQVEGGGGRCGAVEADGHMPPALRPQCSTLPPTTFGYEGGDVGTGASMLSRVAGQTDPSRRAASLPTRRASRFST